MVGLFQFRAITGVQQLRRQLAEPTPEQAFSPLWITRFRQTTYTPKENAKNIRDVTGATLYTGKPKQRPHQDDPPICADEWIHKARQANDSESILWFTMTITQTQTAYTETSKRHCTHQGLQRRWTKWLVGLHGLARTHQRLINRDYTMAVIRENSLHHIRCLKQGLQTALTAKQEYNNIQTKKGGCGRLSRPKKTAIGDTHGGGGPTTRPCPHTPSVR